ncbi:MAG: hypothetical protein CL424_19470, partial [Acidimicrobiaceae bacterium]|nr:hypothetical protein [Acidimicrobiaceae bacterium]
AADIVRLLLRHGPPDLEARNRLGRTALHSACCHSRISAAGGGDAGCIGLLLRAGADPHAQTPDGKNAHDLVADIIAGNLDVAFLGLPGTAPPVGVDSHELARERLVAVLAPNHRSARRKRLRLVDLVDEAFVDFPYGSAGRVQTDRAFSQAKLNRDVAFEVSDVALMAPLIRCGLAVGFLPAPYMQVAAKLDDLVSVEVVDAPTRCEHVAWASHGPSPATAEFLSIIGVPTTTS